MTTLSIRRWAVTLIMAAEKRVTKDSLFHA